MRNLTAEQRSRMAQGSLSLTEAIKVTLATGEVLAFTKYPQNLIVDGLTYLARPGLEISNVSTSVGFGVDNAESAGFYLDGVVTEADVLGRRFDEATYERLIVDSLDTGFEPIVFQSGWIGEFKLSDYGFKVELRSLTQALQLAVGSKVTPHCQAQLGDTKCKVNLETGVTPDTFPPYGIPLRIGSAAIATVVNDLKFTFSLPVAYPDGFFNDGVLRWLTGGNQALSIEVLSYIRNPDGSTGTVVLYEPMGRSLTVGDTFELSAGCDKTFNTCRYKFNNVRNFRGFPYLPGQNRIFDIQPFR